MASPLVTQILNIMGQRPVVEEEKRKRMMQDLEDQLKVLGIVRQNAAATPLANAPQATVEEAAAAQGIPPMSHDVASAAAFPQPKRVLPSITLPGGQVLQPPPLDYEEEAKGKLYKDTEDLGVAQGKLVKITPEFHAQLPDTLKGLFPPGAAVDASTASQLVKSNRYMPVTKTNPFTGETEYHIFDAARGVWVADENAPKGGASAGPDFNLSGEDFLNTLPKQNQELVRAIAEGRQKPPVSYGRTGPGMMLMQQVTAYDPTADQGVIAARWAGRQDMAKGGQFSAKNVIANLGQAAKHLGESQKASNEMDAAGWSTHDSQTINRIGIAMLPKGLQAKVTAYKNAAESVKTEFIKAIKGGTPTVEEQRTLDELSDPSLPKVNRDEAVKTMRGFIQARANVQEDWFQNTFGHPSVEDKQQLFAPNSGWKYDPDTGWTIPGFQPGETQAEIAGAVPSVPGKKGGKTPMELLLEKHGY